MTFALLNGWKLPAAIAQEAQHFIIHHGEMEPTWQNRPQRTRRALPSKWDVRMIPMDRADADTLECLLMGQGHHIPCDVDAFSDAGMGPELGGAYSIQPRTFTAGMYGIGYLNVTGSIVWDAAIRFDGWTVSYWRTVTGTPQHVTLRADGAKFIDGIRADTTNTSECVVMQGGVALGAGNYDDVIILPVTVSDAFASAMYRFAVGKGLRAYLPFDADLLDFFGRLSAPTVSGTITQRVVGRVAKAIQVVSGGRLLYGANVNLDCNGQAECSVEVWFQPTTQVAVGSPQTVVEHGTVATRGYRIRLMNTTASTTNAQIELVIAIGSAVFTTPTRDVVINAWNHVVLTWDQATNTGRCYVNGTQVYTFQTGTAGTAAGNDSADSLFVGNNGALITPFAGLIDEVRFYRSKLTAEDVADHYNAGLRNIPPPVPQAFSKLPYLELDGALLGWRQTQVLADPGDANQIQHGGSAGWLNSSRTPQISFEERQAFEADIIPVPMAQYVLDERYISPGALTFIPAQGAHGNVGFGAANFTNGPFLRGRALQFTSPASNSITLPQALVTALGGSRGMTVVAWARRAATGAQHTLCGLSLSSGNAKFELLVSSGNVVVCRGRSGGDTIQTFTSTIGWTDTTKFHMVAGILDYPADRIRAAFDDTGFQEGVVAFVNDEALPLAFSSGHNIGLDIGGANRWNNEIAVVSIYNQVLTQSELRAIYRQGLRGVFR